MDCLIYMQRVEEFMTRFARDNQGHVGIVYLRLPRRGGVPQDVREKYARRFPPLPSELDRVLAASGR